MMKPIEIGPLGVALLDAQRRADEEAERVLGLDLGHGESITVYTCTCGFSCRSMDRMNDHVMARECDRTPAPAVNGAGRVIVPDHRR